MAIELNFPQKFAGITLLTGMICVIIHQIMTLSLEQLKNLFFEEQNEKERERKNEL